MKETIDESLAAVERERERERVSLYWTWNSFTRQIMFAKREWEKYNKIETKDVKSTSLKIMFNKARKQYIVLRKMKLSGCDP